jgi:hypothetical protein
MADARRTLANISASIMRLPEARPTQLPPDGVAAIGDLIRACDLLISALLGHAAQNPEADELLMGIRAHRRLLFLALAEATPDQARFWTEEFTERERAADAKAAAGLIPRFYSDVEFEETLRAKWLGDDPPAT